MFSRKRSFVWNSFTETGEGEARCNLCSKTVKISKGSTGNLNRHLKINHPTVENNRSSPVNTQSEIMKEVNSFSRIELGLNQSACSSSINIVAVETPVSSSEGFSVAGPSNRLIYSVPNKSQSRLTSFVHKPIPQSRSKLIDHQLVRMITKEYQPLTIVEDVEFKKLINMLNPSYLLPSRKTLTTNLLQQEYLRVSERVRYELSTATAVAITTDSWTSIANQNYIGITAHYIGEFGDLKTSLLTCLEYTESHTAENLSVQLNQCVEEWGIKDKIVAVVSDNAANLKATVRLCGWRHLPCFNHTINLIVQSGVEEIFDIKTKAKSIVEFFKRSPQAYKKLHNTQKQMGWKELKLKQEVPTRWNSTLMMFERLLEVKEPLISTLAITNPSLNQLTPDEWGIIDEACKLLKIFEEVTIEMSTEKKVSVSKTIFLSKSILKHTQDIKRDSDKSQIIRMCDKMIEEIQKRFRDVDSDSLLLESTLLDPRFKRHGLKSEVAFNRAYKKVCDRAKGIVVIDSEKPTEEEDYEVPAKKSKAWEEFDDTVKQIISNDNPTAAAIVEVDKYINDQLIKRSHNPLTWWEEKKHIYPRLYQLMKQRLCVPASSTTCERAFSKAGQLLMERRNRLKSKYVTQIIFLHVNM